MHPRSTPPRWKNARRGPRADCVAPPSHIPDMLSRRALSALHGKSPDTSGQKLPRQRGSFLGAGRLAALGATLDFHRGLLDDTIDVVQQGVNGGPERFEPRAKRPRCASFHGLFILLPPVRAPYGLCAGAR